LKEGFDKGKEPIRAFLMKHAHEKERSMFFNLAKKMRKPEDRESLKPEDFQILIPAFVISELSEAFQIGFVIFLPFLVIDMVVANVLLSLGMFQLSPITVSLPFKLLLFVLVDGWYLIARGLILGYT
jgi:type III secretion protein R